MHSALPKDSFAVQLTKVSSFLSLNKGLLYKGYQLYVSTDFHKAVISSAHNSVLAGHCGHDKTFSLLFRDYWWPGMTSDVLDFIKSCPVCA